MASLERVPVQEDPQERGIQSEGHARVGLGQSHQCECDESQTEKLRLKLIIRFDRPPRFRFSTICNDRVRILECPHHRT